MLNSVLQPPAAYVAISRVPFFEALYNAIWREKDLRDKLIYDVKLTLKDFIALNDQLQSRINEHLSPDYVAAANPDVVRLKESFLTNTKPSTEDRMLVDDEVSVTVLDLRPLGLNVEIPFLESVFLVREEYKAIYGKLSEFSSTFLTGQPGIGKCNDDAFVRVC